MKLARLGVHTGDWQKAWVKTKPPATNLSSVGVDTAEWPSAPMVSNRCWSVVNHSMFGLLGF